jgi:signal peptidase
LKSNKKKNNIFQIILKILFFVFAAVLVSLIVISIISRIQGYLGIGNIEARIVLTGSMEPTINTGSLVFFDKGVDKETLQVGDIIVFNYAEYGDVPITHRITDIQNNGGIIYYICKGDAVSGSYQTVPSSDVIGLVTGSSLFLGNLITFVQKPVVMIVGSLILIIFAVSLFFEPDKDEEDKKTDQDEEIERLQKRLDELSNKK